MRRLDVFLMSLGEEEAAGIFKQLAPKEVQRLGETIAKLKTIPRERVEEVIDKFDAEAQLDSMLVTDTDEYVKSVLRKALGGMLERVNAVATVHRRLFRGEDVERFDVAAFVEDLVADLPRRARALPASATRDAARRRRRAGRRAPSRRG